MFLILGVSLYTFRLLLQNLGIDDYGIYNVVGGIVVLCSFLSNAIRQSTQRYIAFFLGGGKEKQLSEVFSMSINVHVIVAFGIILIAETLGIWFINSKMNIPTDSMSAANIVFQFSIFAFVVQLMLVPYQATIMAYEHMSFYAYFSIVEVILRLGAVLMLDFFDSNRLEIYSAAVAMTTIVIWLGYYIYCKRKFTCCRYIRFWSGRLFKDFFSFSTWNLICGLAILTMTQGTNLLFNICCGVAVNAALGIANQVSNAINNFVVNFQTAFNPQIIKLYANGEISECNALVSNASKYSFILIAIMGIPMIVCSNDILKIWLVMVPDFAVAFTQLIIAYFIIDAVSSPFNTAVQAVGKLKKYSIIISFIQIVNLPIAYCLLSIGYSPVWVIVLRIVLNILCYIIKIWIVSSLTAFNIVSYVKNVTLPIAITLAIAYLFSVFIKNTLANNVPFFVPVVVSIFLLFICSYNIVLDQSEREYVRIKIVRIFEKFCIK